MYKIFDSWKGEYVNAETFQEIMAIKAQLIENYLRANNLFPISHVDITDEGEVWAGCDENGNRIVT